MLTHTISTIVPQRAPQTQAGGNGSGSNTSASVAIIPDDPDEPGGTFVPVFNWNPQAPALKRHTVPSPGNGMGAERQALLARINHDLDFLDRQPRGHILPEPEVSSSRRSRLRRGHPGQTPVPRLPYIAEQCGAYVLMTWGDIYIDPLFPSPVREQRADVLVSFIAEKGGK